MYQRGKIQDESMLYEHRKTVDGELPIIGVNTFLDVFAELMSTVRVATLGQISEALFDVGGAYRRNV
jgi:methylmalonyl-CoA mutase N-terminal domain/subunit